MLLTCFQMAEDKGMDLPDEDQLRLALGLFDLDRDGQLTSKEMMDSLGLVVSSQVVEQQGAAVCSVFRST